MQNTRRMFKVILPIRLVNHMLFILLLIIICLSTTPQALAASLTSFVNPMIGTSGGGDTFPGAVYPQGMVQWSPNNTTDPGGYRYSNGNIWGYSMRNFSGRGCSVYQDILFVPIPGVPSASPGDVNTYASGFSHNNEVAQPGYYQVMTNNGITTALVATAHTGIGQFTYSEGNKLTIAINTGKNALGTTNDQQTGISIDQAGNQMTGTVNVPTSHNCSNDAYKIYFAVTFDQPFSGFGTWDQGGLHSGVTNSNGSTSGGYATFNLTQNTAVIARIGISFVSVAGAQKNLVQESGTQSFTTIKENTLAAWNQRLNMIQVSGGTQDQNTIFYTALYHSLIHPNVFSDVDGHYIGFDKQIHEVEPGQNAQYENLSAWDNYHSLIPFLAVFLPNEASDIAQSLVNDANQGGGGMPRWELANANTGGMQGDSVTDDISQIYTFGARNFDSQTALDILKKHATQIGLQSGGHTVRDNLDDYLKLGYVPTNSNGASASLTIQYAIDDYSLAQFAKALNANDADIQTFTNRARNAWTSLFDPGANCLLQPKNANQEFIPNNNSSSNYNGNGFMEATALDYSLMLPFDLQALFAKMDSSCGTGTALNKLNTAHGGDMGNEPSFVIPWEYDFIGQPWSTQSLVRDIRNKFNSGTAGLIGNDDGGATSNWYIWSALGLYPAIPGIPGFAVATPEFPQITLNLENGKTLTISAPNVSSANIFLQNLNIGGTATQNPWISYADFLNGGNLQFLVGNTPNQNWGKTIQVSGTLPPAQSGGTNTNPTVTALPTETNLTPGPTQNSSTAYLSTGFYFDGIDASENTNPIDNIRTIELFLYQSGNNSWQDPNHDTPDIIMTANAQLNITASNVRNLDFTLNMAPIPITASGTYTVLAKSQTSLKEKLATAFFTIGQTTTIDPISLHIGDINGDNIIDLIDYNILISCYGKNAYTASCLDPNADKHDKLYSQLYSDLNDDGMINGSDYNIFLRNFRQFEQPTATP